MFIYTIPMNPMKCITNRMPNIFQDYKIREHFLHLSFSAPYPKKQLWPWLGFSAKNNLELGHTKRGSLQSKFSTIPGES